VPTETSRARAVLARVAPGIGGAVAAGSAMAAAGVVARRRDASSGLAGQVRRAIARMTTPLSPDDYLHLLNPLWSARELRGRVVKVIRETDDAATLVIRPGLGWSFDYKAGQYVGIGTQLDGRWHWRSYSLSSPPKRDQGHIAITVKAMPEGFLSRHLVEGLAPGTVVRLAPPRGEFVMPDPPPPAVLFVTAGSGITPVMAMLRLLARRGTMPDTVLVHSAPNAASVLFRAELHQLAATQPAFVVHEQLTDTMGALAMSDLATVCPDWAVRETWACGPAGLLDACEQLWESAGIPERLHVERFTVARSATGEGGTVVFGRSGRTAAADGATSLLEAGESVGIQMPFGCRMGICQSCVVPLAAGRVRDLRNGEEHVEGHRIQTCISAAAGDCTLDV
jgi:ferredoxin-NADP reductase